MLARAAQNMSFPPTTALTGATTPVDACSEACQQYVRQVREIAQDRIQEHEKRVSLLLEEIAILRVRPEPATSTTTAPGTGSPSELDTVGPREQLKVATATKDWKLGRRRELLQLAGDTINRNKQCALEAGGQTVRTMSSRDLEGARTEPVNALKAPVVNPVMAHPPVSNLTKLSVAVHVASHSVNCGAGVEPASHLELFESVNDKLQRQQNIHNPSTEALKAISAQPTRQKQVAGHTSKSFGCLQGLVRSLQKHAREISDQLRSVCEATGTCHESIPIDLDTLTSKRLHVDEDSRLVVGSQFTDHETGTPSPTKRAKVDGQLSVA